MQIAIKSPTSPIFPPAANLLTVSPIAFESGKIKYYYELQLQQMLRPEIPSFIGADGVTPVPAVAAVYTQRTLCHGETAMTLAQFDAWEAGEGGNDEYQLKCILENLKLIAA